jgi:hypothetical protein
VARFLVFIFHHLFSFSFSVHRTSPLRPSSTSSPFTRGHAVISNDARSSSGLGLSRLGLRRWCRDERLANPSNSFSSGEVLSYVRSRPRAAVEVRRRPKPRSQPLGVDLKLEARQGLARARLGSKVGQAKPKPPDQGSRLDKPARRLDLIKQSPWYLLKM